MSTFGKKKNSQRSGTDNTRRKLPSQILSPMLGGALLLAAQRQPKMCLLQAQMVLSSVVLQVKLSWQRAAGALLGASSR